MADKLNSDGFLIETTDEEPTEDMQTELSDLIENGEDNILSEDTNDLEDDTPSAQVQRQRARNSHEHETKQPKEKHSTKRFGQKWQKTSPGREVRPN